MSNPLEKAFANLLSGKNKTTKKHKSTGRMLSAKEQQDKTKNWPKSTGESMQAQNARIQKDTRMVHPRHGRSRY